MALWEVNYKVKIPNVNFQDWSNRKYIASHIGRHNEKGIRGNICDIFHDAICEIEDKQIEPMIHYPSTFRKNVDPIPDRFHNDWESKIEWLKDYKYNICPENC